MSNMRRQINVEKMVNKKLQLTKTEYKRQINERIRKNALSVFSHSMLVVDADELDVHTKISSSK